MKKILVTILALVLMVTFALATMSCTEKNRAKNWGGTATIDLPRGQKLVVVTWKEANLWYLVRPMKADEQAETYEFIEDSNFGMLKGKVIIKEHK